MPTLYILQSIKIDIYSREHPPPHFHAIYAEYEALINITELTVYAGFLPKKQHKIVLEWAKEEKTKQFLLTNFYALNPSLKR